MDTILFENNLNENDLNEHLLNHHTTNNVFFLYSEYSNYFFALKNDNVDECKKIFKKSGKLEALIHGQFKYDDRKDHIKEKDELGLLTHPITIAAVYGSINVVKWLLKVGMKPESVREPKIGNIFHCIAQYHTLDGTGSGGISVVCLLESTISTDTVNYLMTDDKEKHGLRPVEIAFRFGAYKLGRQMMNLGNVYLTEYSQRGLVRHCRYDLTVYDNSDQTSESRENKSLIQFLRYVPISFMDDLTHSSILNDQLFLKWMNKKEWKIRFYFFTILWFFIRFLSCPVYIFSVRELGEYIDKYAELFEHNHTNSSIFNNSQHYNDDKLQMKKFKTILGILLSVPLLQRILSIAERFDFHLRRKKHVSRLMPSGSFNNESIAITGSFYRSVRFMADWLAIINCTLMLFHNYIDTNIHALRSYIGVWIILFAVSNLYFIELLFPQNIAHNVILLRITVSAFLTVSFIFFYWLYLFYLLFDASLGHQMPSSFNSTLIGMYSTTKIFVNSLSFEANDQNLMMVHFLLVLMISVCLMNTMTALMTDRMAQMGPQLATYHTLQKLDAMMRIESFCSLGRQLYSIILPICCGKRNETIIWIQSQDFQGHNKKGNFITSRVR